MEHIAEEEANKEKQRKKRNKRKMEERDEGSTEKKRAVTRGAMYRCQHLSRGARETERYNARASRIGIAIILPLAARNCRFHRPALSAGRLAGPCGPRGDLPRQDPYSAARGAAPYRGAYFSRRRRRIFPRDMEKASDFETGRRALVDLRPAILRRIASELLSRA